MTRLPIADWQAALAEMETALDATLAGLDRVEGQSHIGDAPPATETRTALLVRLEERLREWDARLGAAADLASSAERHLDDREAAAGRWQGLLSGWREFVQRGLDPTTPAGGPTPG